VPDFDSIDYFLDASVNANPHTYWEFAREQCPVWREPHHGVALVSGYDEAIAVYHDNATWSACNTVSGFQPFPVPLEGDDVSDLIEQYRDQLVFSDELPAMDPPKHTAHRGLLLRLITPKRLKENEDFMWRWADVQIDEIVDRGECEFVREFAQPLTAVIIADLLGVPEEDRAAATRWSGRSERRTRRRMGSTSWSPTRSRSCTTDSPGTSRTAAAHRATTC